MWNGWRPNNMNPINGRLRTAVMIIGIFIAVMIVASLAMRLVSGSGFSIGGFWWIIFPVFFFFGRGRRWNTRSGADDAGRQTVESTAKRKNDESLSIAELEKPKRVETHLGDDGELIEMPAETDDLHIVPAERAASARPDTTHYI